MTNITRTIIHRRNIDIVSGMTIEKIKPDNMTPKKQINVRVGIFTGIAFVNNIYDRSY